MRASPLPTMRRPASRLRTALASLRPRRSPRESVLPADLYLSVVNSLHADGRTLLIGSMAITLTIFMTAYMARDPTIFLVGVGTIVIAVLRTLDVRAYFRNPPGLDDLDEVRRWESRYTVGAAVHVSLLGLWCLLATLRHGQSSVALISITSVIAYMIGISGRNFGSARLVNVQTVCIGIPVLASFLIMQDLYIKIFSILMMAFFVSFKFISDRLRRTLFDAAIAARNEATIAQRFDTALNNMPHGLGMFDADHHLAVSNGRLGELLGLPPGELRKGGRPAEFLAACTAAGIFSAAESRRLSHEFASRLGGNVEGTLLAHTQNGRTLELTFQAMPMKGSVVLVEDVTERLAAEARIRHLARFDALTGLPNRTYFSEQMDRALALSRRHGSSCGVLFVDLDDFKQVNDTLGHPFGDQLLCAVAGRLREMTRETDIVARFGGDEFVLLAAPIASPDEVASLAERLVERLGEPYKVEGLEIVIGASVGVCIAPDDGLDGDHLLKNADMALYEAKSQGRGTWCFFRAEMDIQARARREMEHDLRIALAEGTFDVYYQPLVNLKSKQISTCEALLRWPHPQRGMISPAEFIPVAEEMGLIAEIGARVLNTACRECVKWPDGVCVAVNLSSIQFRRGNIASVILDALEASGLPPSRLEVEITESVLLQDTEHTRETLKQLRAIGVRVSLDDFGTGYSSLSYLHSFPLDKVKIDRSFLRGISDSERSLTLLRGMTRLSAALGMSVVIEGVETVEEYAVIAGEDSIDEVQGFLFSRPQPAEAVRRLLQATPITIGLVA